MSSDKYRKQDVRAARDPGLGAVGDAHRAALGAVELVQQGILQRGERGEIEVLRHARAVWRISVCPSSGGCRVALRRGAGRG